MHVASAGETGDPRGLRIGGYETTRELGRGGTGVVLEARAIAGGPPVALELLHRVESADARERLRREQRLLRGRLSRPLEGAPVAHFFSGAAAGGGSTLTSSS